MVWRFDIPIPSDTANGPSPKHCSWKKIPKPLLARALSLPSVFHSENLRKDSYLLQVFDSWVLLLPWASSSVLSPGSCSDASPSAPTQIPGAFLLRRGQEILTHQASVPARRKNSEKSPRQHHTEAA